MKCMICKSRDAAVPDRERMGRPIKRICLECHHQRLQGDIRAVFEGLIGRKLGTILAYGTSEEDAPKEKK